MYKRLALSLILVLFLVASLLGCSSNQPAGPGPVDEGSKGIFFEVNGGKNTVYLFGTVHMGYDNMYPLHSSVEAALQAADVLVMEIDLEAVSEVEVAQAVSGLAMYNDGRKLSDFVSAETFKAVEDIFAPLGMDKTIIEMLKPWYVGITLAQLAVMDAGFSEEYGVEKYLMDKSGDKEVMGLESLLSQLMVFDLLSDESGAHFLKEALEELETAKDEVQKLIDLWIAGDVAGYAELRSKEMDAPTESYRAYQEAILDGRDELMTAKLVDLLEDNSGKTYFVAVGSLHLAGPNSIVDLLRQKGYTVNLGN